MTLADGTHIDKQLADHKDKDTSRDLAADKAEYEQNMHNLKDEQLVIYKLSTPIPLTNLMLERPCCIILSGFFIMLLITVFVTYMGWLEPTEPYSRDYLVWGDEYVNTYDKTLLAK